VSRIWYCAICGYEVDRGGRCHNCKEALVPSPLAELPEADPDAEVGYRLAGWDDADRGRLIEELIDGEVLHRFEDDELVVGADDEEAVDAIVAGIGAAPRDRGHDHADEEGGDEDFDGLEALLDAARRLRIDPTDMAADGDLAEAGAAVFAVDHVRGVAPELWASIGRVTRRLLAALGADVALETEISGQAAVLCRLVEPLLSPRAGVATAEATAEATAGAAEQDQDEDRHQVVYDLADWLPEERALLDVLLGRDSIAYSWEGTDIVVSEDDWDHVDALCAVVGRPEPGPLQPVDDPEADDEDGYQALSELFGAADRISGDPDNKAKRQALIDAASVVTGAPVPFGMSDDQWWRIKSRVRSLTESIDASAAAEVIGGDATTLADLLRGFV
jgi:hypothetical protein